MNRLGTTALASLVSLVIVVMKLKGKILLNWSDTAWAIVMVINVGLVIDLLVFITLKKPNNKPPSA